MKQITFLVLIFFVTFPIFSQPMEAEAILEKSIAYHDPQGRWHTFVGNLTVESQSPNASLRTSVIQLDLPKNNYQSTVRQDGNTIVSKWTTVSASIPSMEKHLLLRPLPKNLG